MWEVPDEVPAAAPAYACLAGEAGVATGPRRHLLREAGFERRSVAFHGLLAAGRAALT